MDTSERPKRRLTLLDFMILVAAAAIAFAASRPIISEIPNQEWGTEVVWVFLATLSWAALLLRLKRESPAVRRLVSRPGDAAWVASLLVTIMTGLFCLFAYIRRKMFSGSGINFSDGPIVGIVAAAPTVMTIWLIMAMGRRWRREIDWIGWLGRDLAIGWLLAFFAVPLLL